jgi:hypothetical protein
MQLLNRWKNAFVNIGRFFMAWGSLVAAVPAGFLLSITPFGDLVGKVVRFVAFITEFLINIITKIADTDRIEITDGAPFLLWLGVGLVIIFDLVADLTPNRKAVYGAMIWPSLPLKMGGSWGSAINSWSNSLNERCQKIGGEALGQSAAFTVGCGLVIIAVLAARKVLHAGRDGGSATPAFAAAAPTVATASTGSGRRRRR